MSSYSYMAFRPWDLQSFGIEMFAMNIARSATNVSFSFRKDSWTFFVFMGSPPLLEILWTIVSCMLIEVLSVLVTFLIARSWFVTRHGLFCLMALGSNKRSTFDSFSLRLRCFNRSFIQQSRSMSINFSLRRWGLPGTKKVTRLYFFFKVTLPGIVFYMFAIIYTTILTFLQVFWGLSFILV